MIFASLGSSAGAPASPELVTLAIEAGIGGLIVFVGLLLEKISARDWYRSQSSRKWWTRIGTAGWCILMIGIALEIGAAVKFAVKDDISKKEIRKNAEKNDPLNQPITTLTAFANLELTDLRTIVPDPRSPTLSIWDSSTATNGKPAVLLRGHVVSSAQSTSGNKSLYLSFDINYRIADTPNIGTVSELQKWNRVTLGLDGCSGLILEQGTLIVKANHSSKLFDLPTQEGKPANIRIPFKDTFFGVPRTVGK